MVMEAVKEVPLAARIVMGAVRETSWTAWVGIQATGGVRDGQGGDGICQSDLEYYLGEQ